MFLPRRILFFLLIAIIYGVFGQRIILYLNVDEVCKSGPDPWICKSRNNCTTLRQAIQKGIRPDICSFANNEAIFCCPPEKYFSSDGSNSGSTSTKKPSSKSVEDKQNIKTSEPSAETKATKMCIEYSKYVYRNVTLSPMLPGQKPKNVSLHDCSIEPLIVGGEDAKPKEFPHMALVGYEEDQQKRITWICGGSLISPKFILTAAHCISTDNRFQYWVRLGDLDTSSEKEDSNPVNIRVAKKIIHPQYSDQILYHDIALLELESEAKFNTYVRPLCLHTSKKIESDKFVASGWGHTMWEGRPSSKLQKITLPNVANNKCNNSYAQAHRKVIPKGIVKDWMLCAGGEEGKDTCQGDSGGPLQIQHENIFCMYSIIGIVSYGKGCAFGHPSIYTRVSHYVPWIEKTVWP